jgi:hypothetical protein
MCQLITIIGQDLDGTRDRTWNDFHFLHMRILVNSQKVQDRIRFALQVLVSTWILPCRISMVVAGHH